jgi:hypothetical protein
MEFGIPDFICHAYSHGTCIGLCQPSLVGQEYLPIEEEFMEAVQARWPAEIVQVNLEGAEVFLSHATFTVASYSSVPHV